MFASSNPATVDIIRNRAGFVSLLQLLSRRGEDDGGGSSSGAVVGVIIVSVVIGLAALIVCIYVRHADRSRSRRTPRRHPRRGRRGTHRDGGGSARRVVRQRDRLSPLKFFDVRDLGRGKRDMRQRDDVEMARPRRAHLR
ncbi:hypothetical protein JDV02_003550 [Purpureocillium takamizusanense]|uniref:Uncharacterized protein n=1 Tax=Purpureocillium takamizusanense TaxID=2060973 RepID=A0A9Q8QCM0_9HYPO|nr:uncharacterized protein JDV02_003550 [Purpureocillium takamizusanense]UNI17175.1 hypothetical protein JDV02_003550 [Purpureocillium takamizusanense]